jgi:site-specific recombinase XerD
MSLIKRPNSRYWYVQFQVNHRTYVRSTRSTDRRIAERIAAKIQQDANSERFLGSFKATTLIAALDRFIASKVGQPNVRNQIAHKAAIVRILGGSTPLSSITSASLEHFRHCRTVEGCAPQTVKHGISCVMGAIKMSKRDGYAVSEVQAPTIKLLNGRLRYLSVDEERRLLAELDPNRKTSGLSLRNDSAPDRQRFLQDNYDLIVVLLDTGARYSEIAQLKWDQVDMAHKAIRLWRPKVSNESLIFMTTRVHDTLVRRQHARTGGYVFTNKAGSARGYAAVSIRKAFDRAELHDCTIHTLRHTHATRLIQAGLTLYEVKAVLGHSDIRTTMRYAHLEQATVTVKARDVIEKINSGVPLV